MKRKKWLIIFLILVAVIIALAFVISARSTKKTGQPLSTSTQASSSPSQKTTEPKPSLPFIDLQPTVDTWAAKQSGSASVVIYDLANKKINASVNPDKQFYTASIYKLYVAYYGYQKVADGTYKMDDAYLTGYNRGKCLDEMIRSSYSPCGEKMRSELNKESLSNTLKSYDLKNTSVEGLYTSAADTALILQRLFEKQDLTDEHTTLFLDSMKNQPAKYRVGLPNGFDGATVYNKVGWNESLEWHDTAIVILPNGRSYVVCVLTRSVGRSNVVELAKKINAELSK